MKIGKRYWFYASDDAKRIRSGLFTGRFTTKGNAMYERYHVERIENAFEDIDALVRERRNA